MKDFKLFRLLMAATVFTLPTAGMKSVAKELKIVELNCDVLGRLSIKEAEPNEDDLRNPLSDFLILTLPNGNKTSMVRSPGANVRNWTSPSSGITFSQAPTWSREQVSFERDSYGYRQGTYECDSKW
jgi:hypothetical protein